MRGFHISDWAVTAALLVAVVTPGDLSAATAEEVLARIPELVAPEDLVPGSDARAKAITDLLAANQDLPALELLKLRLAVAQAWLDGGRPDRTQVDTMALLSDPTCVGDVRERAGLTLVAAHRFRLRSATNAAAVPAAVAAVAAAKLQGDARVQASALACDAERLLIDVDNARNEARLSGQKQVVSAATANSPILGLIDQAIAVLKGGLPDERTPLYALRLDAMERLGLSVKAVQDWLTKQQSDPAVEVILSSAFSAGDKLVGGPAPALSGQKFGGLPGEQVTVEAKPGKATLVYFFASWSQPSEVVTAAVVRAAADHPNDLAIIGVSLDRKDSIANLTAYMLRHGMTFPVIAEGIGWDGQLDEAWHIEGIPALMLVSAEGILQARDLTARDTATTLTQIAAALAAASASASVPAARSATRASPR